jgi:hypothetical protein
MDIRKWATNKSENRELMDKIEDEAIHNLTEKLGFNLEIFEFDKTFSLDDLNKSLESLVKKDGHGLVVDLIVIDHLQYFDIDDPRKEYHETTKIVKAVKDIANFHHVPSVVISHLRKKSHDRGLPNQEDFFGTSNAVKICSQAIVMCPASDGENHSRYVYPTYFRVVKSRTGIRSSLAMLCNFRAETQKYDNDYKVCSVVYDKPHKELTGNDLPKWARRPVHKRVDESARIIGERLEEGNLYNAPVLDEGQPVGAVVRPEDIKWEE